MRFIGKVILFFGGAEVLYGLYILFDDAGFNGSPGTHLLIGVSLIFIGGMVTAVGESSVMRAREERAKLIVARLQAGQDVKQFSLYLRPFSTTEKFHVSNPDPRTIPATPASLYTPKSFELEDSLATALDGFAPLIALGRPGGNLGAGKITVDDQNWQQSLTTLAAAATIICIVPGHHDGTRWEIEYLKRMKYLNRAVFFMPPSTKVPDPKIDAEKYWAEARIVLQQSGVTLPPYSRGGLIFTLSEEGELARSAQAGALISHQSYLLLNAICSVSNTPIDS